MCPNRYTRSDLLSSHELGDFFDSDTLVSWLIVILLQDTHTERRRKSDGTRRWRCLYNWRAPKAQLTELTCAPAPATFFFCFLLPTRHFINSDGQAIKNKDGREMNILSTMLISNFFKDFSFQNFDAVNVTNRIGIVNFFVSRLKS